MFSFRLPTISRSFGARRLLSAAAEPTSSQPILLKSFKNGVLTLTMNSPKNLNAWSLPMLNEIIKGFKEGEENKEVKVLVLTGQGSYYCAGVDLSKTFKFDHPQKMWEMINKQNQMLFDSFLDYPKPILVAVNGHAIGASVTSATLCDGIIASDQASFLTPFQRLGIPPEGCSSVHFARIMKPEVSQKMLFENLKVTSQQAKEAGFVIEVYPQDKLVEAAQALAEKWIHDGKKRTVAADLKQVNASESAALASAFLSKPFLLAQFAFLWSKKKYMPAIIFRILAFLRPAWKLLLKQ